MAHNFALVADRDSQSRDANAFEWRSELQFGFVQQSADGNYTLSLGGRRELISHTARANRSMELSDLAVYRGRLYAVCDFTGIVHSIDRKSMAFQRFVLVRLFN